MAEGGGKGEGAAPGDYDFSEEEMAALDKEFEVCGYGGWGGVLERMPMDRSTHRWMDGSDRPIDPMVTSNQNTKQHQESPRTRRKKQRERNRRAREKGGGKPGQAGGGKQPAAAAAAKGGKGGCNMVIGRWG